MPAGQADDTSVEVARAAVLQHIIAEVFRLARTQNCRTAELPNCGISIRQFSIPQFGNCYSAAAREAAGGPCRCAVFWPPTSSPRKNFAGFCFIAGIAAKGLL